MLVSTKENDMDPCPICGLFGWHEACEEAEFQYWNEGFGVTYDPYDHLLSDLEEA